VNHKGSQILGAIKKGTGKVSNSRSAKKRGGKPKRQNNRKCHDHRLSSRFGVTKVGKILKPGERQGSYERQVGETGSKEKGVARPEGAIKC